jgi:hypothetical protein
MNDESFSDRRLRFHWQQLCRHMLAKYPDYELINVDKIGIGANPQTSMT